MRRALGPLAADTRSAARARHTLQVFLAAGSSPSRAAARLGVHRNTVAQRLKAIAATQEDLEGRSLELQLALHLVERLGPVPR